ncbi:ATP-dependent DNA helicase Q1-like [Agrilus planipennis]|uniref:ATP-dependent DNA helicase n=1 Tax=Agrilus planipennis TaxID=224129 RepID=A0A1W4XCT5_AGRPL|nr:ATP-dependent DNA helicase Q1-like [Agrilus planipennis]XP_018333815.1 ATP-dependent DNA helicase Q1-like [Agrilus planipennis]
MSDDLLKKITKIEEQIKSIQKEQAKLNEKLRILNTERDELKSKYNLEKTKKESEKDWSGNFPWTEKVFEILKNIFKLKEFRSKQLSAINATLSKKDVLLLMPTGGGKSLCYQLPSLVERGTSLVISPLISLIEDQIINLKKLGVSAETINSSTSKESKKNIYQYMAKNQGTVIKLIFVTPEWLAKSKMFMSNLQKCYALGNLNRIVIDEVHCCSQWGHDFRPDYKYLGLLKGMFSDVPILGLTATATMSVILDIQEMLDISGCTVLRAPFFRPNLFYEVLPKPSDAAACLDYLEKLMTTNFKEQSGIIYALSIKDTEELSKGLRERGLKVHYYHANLEPEARSAIHERWLRNKYQAVIATVAFGMGIDKPDVRFVIHHSLPKSLEGFYQESGRAGRDGKPARCIVLYKLSDYFRVSSLVGSKVEENKVKASLEYCLAQNTCRHKQIASHFEDGFETVRCEKMCDHCKNPRKCLEVDVTSVWKDIYTIMENAESNGVNLTLLKLIDAWYSTGAKELRVDTVKKPRMDRITAEYLVANFLQKGLLKEEKNYTAYSVNVYLKINRKSDAMKNRILVTFKEDAIPKGLLPFNKDSEEPPPKRMKT